MDLSVWLNPVERGLATFQVSFTLPESGPVPSMLDEGIVFIRPVRTLNARVWAANREDVNSVLAHHYSDKPTDVLIS